MQPHSIETTAVSTEAVYCDGKILAQMSNGGLLEFSIDRAPSDKDLSSYGALGWKYKTRDQLVGMVFEANADARSEARHRLFWGKVARLGLDHRARGYY